MFNQRNRPVYESGDCEVDLARREFRARGVAVPLGSRAFEIVAALIQSLGQLVTKDELMDRVWSGAIVGDNTLQVHISAIRKALGSSRGLLKTESGRGYRLLGEWAVREDSVPAAAMGLEPAPLPMRQSMGFLAPTSDLIGQTATVERIRSLLSAYRVVTLTGPGGIGKTTLALRAAHEVASEFDGGPWLVELGSLFDPNLVPSAVIGVLGLKLGGETISPEAVARAIGGQNLLLILDNCEHVIAAAASLTEALARSCPGTTVLATGREALRIDGEFVYRIPPLEVPAPDRDHPDDILGHSAVELFIARTKALDSDFSPHAENLPAIATICRHLDGIPLAIEFAAARAATLGVSQVAIGLRDRFGLLTSGRRTALPRHRTLRATLDWSYELLPEPERLLLRRLAIFPGGFTRDAAVAVVKDTGLEPSAVVDGIANLVSKSLVALDNRASATRWSLLETVRAYAIEKLASHDQAAIAARHHAEYFRDLLAPGPDGGPRSSAGSLTRRAREIDNVRVALDWAFSDTGDRAIGVDITAFCAPVWAHLSLMGECRDRCEQALQELERQEQTTVIAQRRLRLRIALASALFATLGPSEQTKAILIEAVQTAETLDDLEAQARALTALANVQYFRGEFAAARATTEQLGEVARNLNDPAIIHYADRLMGNRLTTMGRAREAQPYFERIIRSAGAPDGRERTFWYRTNEHVLARAMLARVLWMQGFADRAHSEAQKSLEELQGPDEQLMVCRTLYYGVARIAPMTGDFATADQAITRLIDVSTRLQAPFWITAGRLLQGKAWIVRGEFAQGLPVLREALDTCARTGWHMSYPEFKGTLAVALAGLGQLEEALETVNDAMASAGEGETAQRWYVPELFRIKGELLLRQATDDSPSSAEYCFDQAGDLAREQGALFWELRVALSVARVRMTQGQRDSAKQVLAPVYARFTEGFGTADMISARQLLDSLS